MKIIIYKLDDSNWYAVNYDTYANRVICKNIIEANIYAEGLKRGIQFTMPLFKDDIEIEVRE